MHYFVFMIRCTEVKLTVIVRKDMDGDLGQIQCFLFAFCHRKYSHL